MEEENGPESKDVHVQLRKLAAQLQEEQEAQHATQQTGQPTAEQTPTIFGFTPGALFAGLLVSLLGAAYLRFARSMGEPIIAVLGVVMLAVPFFVTNAWILVGTGAGVLVLTFALRRFLRY